MSVIQIPPARSAGVKAAQVLDEAARRRRRTIRWPADSSWLQEITPAPQRLLNRMKERRLLYAVGSNRYVIAPHGTTSVEQAASPELLTDLALGPHGPYYVGFLSSLIAHRLTDLHSETTFVAVQEGHRPRNVPSGLKVAELSASAWPADGTGEIERVRVIEGFKEFAFRSSLERSLLDGLLRPDLCAGIETVVSAWARASRRSDVSWDQVAQIARRMGGATSRRAAFMLKLLDLDPVVDRHFADLEGRRTSTLLDRSRGFGLEATEIERDPRTGVVLNVPRSYLRGWVDSGKLRETLAAKLERMREIQPDHYIAYASVEDIIEELARPPVLSRTEWDEIVYLRSRRDRFTPELVTRAVRELLVPTLREGREPSTVR